MYKLFPLCCNLKITPQRSPTGEKQFSIFGNIVQFNINGVCCCRFSMATCVPVRCSFDVMSGWIALDPKYTCVFDKPMRCHSVSSNRGEEWLSCRLEEPALTSSWSLVKRSQLFCLLGLQDIMAPQIQDLFGLDQREKKSKPKMRFAFLLFLCILVLFIIFWLQMHLSASDERGKWLALLQASQVLEYMRKPRIGSGFPTSSHLVTVHAQGGSWHWSSVVLWCSSSLNPLLVRLYILLFQSWSWKMAAVNSELFELNFPLTVL